MSLWRSFPFGTAYPAFGPFSALFAVFFATPIIARYNEVYGGGTDRLKTDQLPSFEGVPTMSNKLMEVMLPRLAKPLYKHLERFQTGKLNEEQFTERFETLLQRQHQWLSKRGISAARAAIAIHAAVLVLSLPGSASRSR